MATDTGCTPMLQQYWQIRNQCTDPNTILFFRLGDFYEMFFEDAEVAAPLLDITLTSRNRNDPNPIPLCGVPYHSAEGYIAKLLAHGKKVAICEQVEDPKTAKGVVRREIVRWITPGAVLTTEALPARESNYLAAVHGQEGHYGVALIDISTGEFRVTQCASLSAVIDTLGRQEVREILFPRPWQEEAVGQAFLAALQGRAMTPLAATQFDPQQLPPLDGLTAVAAECPAALPAAGGIWAYLTLIQRHSVDLATYMQRITIDRSQDYLVIDEAAKRNLELTRTMVEGNRHGSLLAMLDQTVTAMGARRLKTWLLFPLLDPERIAARLDGVERLVGDVVLLQRTIAVLKRIGDLERLSGRIVTGEANARDCIGLCDSCMAIPALQEALADTEGILGQAGRQLDPLVDVREVIAQTLVDDPPLALKEGGLIRAGYATAIDELRQIHQEGKGFIARLEATERARTGIATLKVRYNQVFGYYIEITHTHRDKVPSDYIRKQTLTNAERYITPELKAYEEKVLTAGERLRQLEYETFLTLRQQVVRHAPRIKTTAEWVATIDVLTALAALAQAQRYCRPKIVQEPLLKIIGSRHPVVEQLATERFIPNDCVVDGREDRLLVITGPNMAGKSTVMRQVALITILAQMGSFVPAQEATIGIVDRIFTRVGATDNLARGQSTFMVEMAEAATILAEATARSLIIIDEIGRGTSTFDGVAIAWSIAEFLHDRVRARTLFATHFHELADLVLTKTGARNFTMAVKEWNDQIVFLRKLIPGAVNRSYGIQVAKLAGLPAAVVQRAAEILANLEQGELNDVGQPRFARGQAVPPETAPAQLVLFRDNAAPRQVVEQLCTLSLDTTTPIEALNLLHTLKTLLVKGDSVSRTIKDVRCINS